MRSATLTNQPYMAHIQDEALEVKPAGYVCGGGRRSVHRENCEGSGEGIGAIQHLGQYPLHSCCTSFLRLFSACLMLIPLGLVEMLSSVDLHVKF